MLVVNASQPKNGLGVARQLADGRAGAIPKSNPAVAAGAGKYVDRRVRRAPTRIRGAQGSSRRREH